MAKHTIEQLGDALKVIESTITRCEKIQPKFPQGSAQYTLLKNRIRALQISKSLLIENNGINSFTEAELTEALRPIASIIHKCEMAQQKYSAGSAQYNRYIKTIRAMLVAKDLITDKIPMQDLEVPIQNRDRSALMGFLDAYNRCFYEKDLDRLRTFYDSRLIYLDNHKGNDTYDLEHHLKLLSAFFKNGKTTESGEVEPLIIENMHIFENGQSACMCYHAKYRSFPDPAVRCTLYLEYAENAWKIVHVHCSFQPDQIEECVNRGTP